MAQNSKKIIEISGNDWMSSLSIYPYSPVGGLFQKATNFNPFEKPGLYVPSQKQSRIGAGVTTNGPFRWIVPFASSAVAGVTYFYAFSTSELFLGRTTQGALPGGGSGFIEDQSSRITSPWFGDKGAIKYKDRIVYIGSTGIAAGTIPLPSTPVIVKLLGNLTNTYVHWPHIGPDRVLYVTNSNHIAKITSVTGTTGNDAQFLSFEDDVVTRGIADDGQNLIIVGDTQGFVEPNIGTATGKFRCFVAFWNLKSKDLLRMWEFKDNSVSGIATVEDEVLVFGSNNIYTCSIGSKPKAILPKGGNSNIKASLPEPGTITKINDSLVLWSGRGYNGDSNNDRYIYGYGRTHPSLPKALFTAHDLTGTPGGTSTIFSMFYDGGNTDKLFACYGNNNILIFSGTNNTSTCKIAGIDFKQPYEFDFAKVILNSKLANGQSVDLEILTDEGNNTVLRDTQYSDNRFSFTQVGGKKSHIFYPFPGAVAASSIAVFEDLSDIQIRNIGAEVRRVEIWGHPINPSQDIYK